MQLTSGADFPEFFPLPVSFISANPKYQTLYKTLFQLRLPQLNNYANNNDPNSNNKTLFFFCTYCQHVFILWLHAMKHYLCASIKTLTLRPGSIRAGYLFFLPLKFKNVHPLQNNLRDGFSPALAREVRVYGEHLPLLLPSPPPESNLLSH